MWELWNIILSNEDSWKQRGKSNALFKSTQWRWNRSQSNSFYPTTTTFLIFSVEVESYNLIPQRRYSDRQHMVYLLIKYLHEQEGLGYRKISQKLNSWGIKTQRGKEWFNTSVFSVLKRKHQRDERVRLSLEREYPVRISKFSLHLQTFSWSVIPLVLIKWKSF